MAIAFIDTLILFFKTYDAMSLYIYVLIVKYVTKLLKKLLLTSKDELNLCQKSNLTLRWYNGVFLDPKFF